MLADRKGADLVEWIVVIVIAIGVVGISVFSLFQTLAGRFWELNNSINP